MKKKLLIKRTWIVFAILLWHFFMLTGLSYADNAAVLPKDAYQIKAESFIFRTIEKQFNADGDKEPFATPFNVPLAPLVETILGASLPFGTDLGRNAFTIELERSEMKFTPAFGLTDRFSIGVVVPWIHEAKTRFDGNVNTSTANFGLNSNAISLANPLGLAPIGSSIGGEITDGVNIDEINSVLVANGFRPLRTSTRSGFGDVEVGGRYQYFRSDFFRAAFTGGVRFPTGEEDDPDDLLDQPLGEGAYALLFQFQQDFIFQEPGLGRRLGFPSPGDFFLNLNFEYDLVLPDKQTLRVCPRANPLCSTKAKLDRDLGDVIRAETQATIGLLKGLIFQPLYLYQYRLKNDFSGPSGVPVEVLEQDSSQQTHEYKLQLTFTTIPWVVEKKFPVPLVFSINYRDRFAGDNFVNNSQFFGFNVTVYGVLGK